MLDTIRVKWPISPTQEQLSHWICKTTKSEKGKKEYFIYNTKFDEALLKFTYYPLDYKLKPLLSLEVSLPKLLFDNNYRMLGSIDGTIKITNILLDGLPNLPHLDISEGILIRLDMCYNHQVGDMVDDYVEAIGRLEYPHRRTKHHRFEGAEFRSKHITTKFYNKEHETGCIEAKGILRQETTLLRGKDIQKFLGKPKPTLLDVTYEKVTEYLQNDLAKLGLLNNSIATRDTALKQLCESHGEYAGYYYFGILNNKQKKSRKELKRFSNAHARSIDRRLRKIVDTGIPLTLTDQKEPLPPLLINTKASK